MMTPDHLAESRDNPASEAQRQAQLSQWRDGIVFQQRQGCETYEALMAQSAATRQFNFILEHSWGLILAGLGMVIGLVYGLSSNSRRRY